MSCMRHVCAGLVVLAAVAPAWAAPSAEEAVAEVCKGLGQANARVVWDALPASYQEDVAFLVHTGATKIDPALWRKTFELGQKLVDILKTKKEWILANPMLQQAGPERLEPIKAGYDDAVGMLALLVNSELADLDKVKKLDIGKFAGGTGSKLIKRVMALQQAVGSDDGPELAKLADAKVTQIDLAGGVATLKLQMPDGDGVHEEVEQFVQVGDKWVPQKMAAGWQAGIADAKAKLLAMDPKPDPAKTQQQLAMLNMVGAQLDLLAQTETAEQFNGQLGAIMGFAMMQIQQQMQAQQQQAPQPSIQ